MDFLAAAVYGGVYAGMIAGRLPGLALDRTGVALLGAIAMVATGRIDAAGAWAAVDHSTITLLFALMVVSAQFRLSGLYSWVVRRLAALAVPPQAFAALLVAAAGLLSALLANDIVCFAAAPVLVESCRRRGLDPRPFLLALACAANVGSAGTLIGNPQNMLIGQTLGLSFRGYLAVALVPTAAGLAAVWAVVCLAAKGRWERAAAPLEAEAPPFSPWQTAKGLAVLTVLLAAFIFSPWPRDVTALAGAGLLLCSRRMRSREVLALVDWQLIVLFVSLFIVNGAMAATGSLDSILGALSTAGVRIQERAWLFAAAAVLSNVVSNVPAVMLLLPAASGAAAGTVLALSSTLAGNFLMAGSIANIIVADQAGRMGEGFGWRDHARVGVPVTLLTLAIAALWLGRGAW